MARETPVGPPWITTSSQYLRDGVKSTGLWRTPSIVAPSWLFHDTISSVLVVQFAVCAFMPVSFFVCCGVRLEPDSASEETGATNTSAIDFASEPRQATFDASREKLKLEPTHESPSDSPAIPFLSRFMPLRY